MSSLFRLIGIAVFVLTFADVGDTEGAMLPLRYLVGAVMFMQAQILDIAKGRK